MFYIICFFLTFMAFNCYLANNILSYLANKKYSKIKNDSGVSGESFARDVLDALNLKDVEVKLLQDRGRNFFNFKNGVINLKSLNFNGSSIRDIAVVLNLVRDAVLFKEKCFWVKLRLFLVSKIRFCFCLSFIIVMLFGPILQKPKIAFLGIILFLLTCLFEFITLFGEFSAKKRATKFFYLKNILKEDDIFLVEKFLKSAFFFRLINLFICFFIYLIFAAVIFPVC